MKDSLKIAAGIGITLGVIAIMFFVFNAGKTSAYNSMGQYNDMMSQYDNMTYAQYDGTSIPGSEVVRVLQNMSVVNDGVKVTVKTKMDTTTGTEYTVSSTGTLTPAIETDKSANAYINPSASFECKVTRNANNLITDVIFTQK